MEVKQTEKFVPSGPSTSWARDSINVFGGPILQRSMIRQDFDSHSSVHLTRTFEPALPASLPTFNNSVRGAANLA